MIKDAHQRVKRKAAINGLYSSLFKCNKVETIGIENSQFIDYQKDDGVFMIRIQEEIFG